MAAVPPLPAGGIGEPGIHGGRTSPQRVVDFRCVRRVHEPFEKPRRGAVLHKGGANGLGDGRLAISEKVGGFVRIGLFEEPP